MRPELGSIRGEQFRLSTLGVAVLMVFVFVVGLILGERTEAGSQGGVDSSNRPVSHKVWVTAAEINARFSPDRHDQFMRRAIHNSRVAGVEMRTGGAFGAVIVDRNGEILADGSNHVVSQSDPTWHAEMEAIRTACARLKALKLDGCVLYTSSEPCPMCLATCYWAGLDGVFYGASVADSKKFGGFDDQFIYEQFAKPAIDRSIPETQLLKHEAVDVWKEYAALKGNVPY